MKRVRMTLVFCAIPLLLPTVATAQIIDSILSLHPLVSIPLGPREPELPYYDAGGGGSLRVELIPSFARWLYGGLSVDYEYAPLHGATQGVSFASAGATIGLAISPVPQLSVKAGAGGGVYIGIVQEGTVRDPFFEGRIDASFLLSPSLALGAGARYRLYAVPEAILYQGVSIDLGVSYNLAGSLKGTNITTEFRLDPVFPLFYGYYDTHPLGTARVVNNESIPVEKVRVTFYAKQYMDAPRLCASLDAIGPGTTKEIPIYGLFNDAIFKVTEGTMAAGELVIEYYYLGRAARKTLPVTVQVQNRNAMTWDDDNKVAAFVTAKDPLVLSFAKEVASFARTSSQAVSAQFRQALGIFQALGAYGIAYTVDPKTPFESTSAKETTIDFLQFPNQTLAYRAGDCDDLTALYCALLESIGVSSALITVPGHIFAAFDSGLAPDEARGVLINPADAIQRDGTVWIPVEVTMIKDGFLRAWSAGAAEWREASGKNAAAFYPVSEAWKLYAPIGFTDAPAAATFPAREALREAYHAEMSVFARSAVAGRATELQAQIRSGRGVEKAANALGVLYARYGLLDEARAQFILATRDAPYVPGLVNLGNLAFIAGDMPGAKSCYEQALAAAPADVKALVGFARSLQHGDDTMAFQNAVARLAALYPSAAAQAFPGGVTAQRASSLDIREIQEWHD